jgi:hyaluronan synthase
MGETPSSAEPDVGAMFSDMLIKNMRYPIGYAALAIMVKMSVSDPTTVLRLLFAIGIMALFNMFYYLRSERSWDFLYGMLYAYFSFFGLFWIFPWAVLLFRTSVSFMCRDPNAGHIY